MTRSLSTDRLNVFSALSDQWFFELDERGALMFSGGNGKPTQAVWGVPMVDCFLPLERPRLEEALRQCWTLRTPLPAHEYWLSLGNGLRAPMMLTFTPVPDPANPDRVMALRGCGTPCGEVQRLRDLLWEAHHTDMLTGLGNRASLLDALGKAQRLHAHAGLLVLDVVRFSALNMALGHDMADKVLCHVAYVLETSIRSYDHAVRLDSDRFAVLFGHLHAPDLKARVLAVQKALQERRFMAPSGPVSLAVTMAALPVDGTLPGADQLTQALFAMARSKAGGAGKVVLTHPADDVQHEALTLPHTQHQLVQQALQWPDERLELHFQAIQPLRRGTQDLFEVLVRVKDEHGQIYPPAAWMPGVQAFGLCEALDRAVVRKALDLLSTWHTRGRRLALAVNIYPSTLVQPGWVDELVAVMQRHALPYGSLTLELTESTALPPLSALTTAMRALRRVGVTFALDDVGTGYATLNLLKHLELDFVKIDGAFIRQLASTPSDQALVQALVQATRPQGVATIAEMVENEAALRTLTDLGVDYVQGFFVAPPQGAPEARAPEGWDAVTA